MSRSIINNFIVYSNLFILTFHSTLFFTLVLFVLFVYSLSPTYSPPLSICHPFFIYFFLSICLSLSLLFSPPVSSVCFSTPPSFFLCYSFQLIPLPFLSILYHSSPLSLFIFLSICFSLSLSSFCRFACVSLLNPLPLKIKHQQWPFPHKNQITSTWYGLEPEIGLMMAMILRWWSKK